MGKYLEMVMQYNSKMKQRVTLKAIPSRHTNKNGKGTRMIKLYSIIRDNILFFVLIIKINKNANYAV